MEERKFVQFKKEEFRVREFIKKSLGKGKISSVKIEYTPIGEKIVIATSKPGMVIGKAGEKINELTDFLKRRFGLENPHIEIKEIMQPELDAQIMADEMALAIERFGPLKFKAVAYKALQRIMHAGALGVEIRLSGRLPSERAKTWRFAQGYLKKTGEPSKVVDRAHAVSKTTLGVIGVKVSILPPTAKIHDRIEINDAIRNKIRTFIEPVEEIKETKSKSTKNKDDNKKKRNKKA